MSNKKVNVKKAILIIIACITITGIVSTTWAYVDNQKKIKAEQLKIEEEKRKAEEEKKKYTVGTSHEGKKYSYDASVVAETKLTESGTSLSYFVANIVVVAADGAEVAITVATSILPLTPKR